MEKLTKESKKELYKMLATLALPIILQNTIMNSMAMIDTMMISYLGNEAVVAVSIASKLHFIFNLIIYGFFAGGGIFIAQYNGSKQYEEIKKTMVLILSIGIITGIIFTFIGLFLPDIFLKFFTKDETIIKLGVEYLKYFSFGIIPFAISFAFIIGMRSIKDSKIPMYVTVSAMIVNVILNYCLIFGKYGFLELKVGGAALATTISRFVEMFAMIYFVYFRNREKLKANLSYIKKVQIDFIKKYFIVSYPIIISDGLWGIGIMGYFYAYSKLGTDMFAATQMAQTVNDITLPASFGLASATGTILGNKLGEGKIKEAILYSKIIMRISIITGIAIGLLLLLIIPIFPIIFKTTAIVAHYVTVILLVRVIINMFFPFDWTNVLGILRSGGDTIYGMFIDLGPMYLITMPLAIGMVVYWNKNEIKLTDIHLILVIGTMLLEEIIKIIIGLPRVLSNKWAKNLVNQ